MYKNASLSFSARKALSVHIGEKAGNEIADLIQLLVAQIEELKRGKVNVTPIVPVDRARADTHEVAAFEHDVH